MKYQQVGERGGGAATLQLFRLLVDILIGVLSSVFYVLREILHVFWPPAPKSLAGQHVLVTGAGRGLGREMCVRLAREGCSRVTCLDVDLEGARETARLVEAAGGRAGHARCDVTRRDQLASLLSSLPPVDVLINNAGIVSGAPILQVTDEQIDNMIGVNLMAHFHTIRAVLPSMLKRGGGHIVGISSAAAFTAAANIAPYAATKYAVTGMMYSLREEMRKFHPEIKVTSVHPFFISPPPHCLEHWQKKSRIPDVSATEVADKTVEGIKRNKATVVVPSYLYHLLVLLMAIPAEAGDLWRDIFYANISPLEGKNKDAKDGDKEAIS